jgi:hypothetical protein
MSKKLPIPILEKILQRIGHPELTQILAGDLSGSELNTLLLEVFARRVKAMSPPDLLNSYKTNRLVKPTDLPVIALREMELDYLRILNTQGFEAVELSPVTSLGSCAIVGTTSQHKVLSALRGTEVLPDATNALALHIAYIKKQGDWNPAPDEVRHFSVIQRHVRTQTLPALPGFTPHFKIAALVSAGYDTGSYTFECHALIEHIRAVTQVYQHYHHVTSLRFRLLCRQGYADNQALAEKLKAAVNEQLPETSITIIAQPPAENAYYQGVQYKIDIEHGGRTFEIGDGGFVNWTQLLLQNKKERMFTTGLGFEFMYRIVNQLI